LNRAEIELFLDSFFESKFSLENMANVWVIGISVNSDFAR